MGHSTEFKFIALCVTCVVQCASLYNFLSSSPSPPYAPWYIHAINLPRGPTSAHNCSLRNRCSNNSSSLELRPLSVWIFGMCPAPHLSLSLRPLNILCVPCFALVWTERKYFSLMADALCDRHHRWILDFRLALISRAPSSARLIKANDYIYSYQYKECSERRSVRKLFRPNIYLSEPKECLVIIYALRRIPHNRIKSKITCK